MKSPFLMNMKGREFTSTGALSIRGWFGRMVEQLEFNTNTSGAGRNWNSAEMYIIMHSNTWNCITHIYDYRQIDDLIFPRVLPIGGRLYPVILDSQIPQVTNQGDVICSDIYFVTTRIGGEAIIQGQYQELKPSPGKPCLSGIIQNVCVKEIEVTNDNTLQIHKTG